MKQKSQTSKFSFVLNNQQTMNNIDHLKMVDYQKFKQVNHIGTTIQSSAKDDDWQVIDKIVEEHHMIIPFVKLEIQDAFVSALNLRNTDTIRYFLENGFDINSVAEDAALTVCYSLQYLKGTQAPLDLLTLVLSYGASPRKASDRDSQTPMHLAAQNGDISFLKLLLEYGADINAISDDRQTPLGSAIRCKQPNAVAFLRQKGGSEKCNF